MQIQLTIIGNGLIQKVTMILLHIEFYFNVLIYKWNINYIQSLFLKIYILTFLTIVTEVST